MYKEIRRYPRYSVSAKAMITRKDGDFPEKLTTRVITISQGGMGVYTDECVKKTTPVSIELLSYTNDGLTKADIFEGRIASVCSQERDYFVGIAFDKEISHDRFIDIIS